MIGPHPFHAVGEKYIAAVVQAADCLPLLIPVLETPLDVTRDPRARRWHLLSRAVRRTWSRARYAGPASVPGTLHDPHRDATTLSLIPRAVASGVPVFGVCRGFQEMNVAMGGTLHQRVHEVDGLRRSSRGQGAAARRAVRAGARRGARAGFGAAQARGQGAHQRELAALAGRRPARRPISRSRRARPTGWSRRSA